MSTTIRRARPDIVLTDLQMPGMDGIAFCRGSILAKQEGAHAGLGLGLYIVKGIVESHGGHVSAQSHLAGGSTFYVYLPDSRAVSEASSLGGVDTSAPARA